MAELDADAMTLCPHCSRPREEHVQVEETI